MNERCERICGKSETRCFVSNRKQLKCIADMILNKVSVSSLLLESAIANAPGCEGSEKAGMALKSLDELVSWIKFLQMAHDLRETIELFNGRNTRKNRKQRSEIRYPLPEIYRKYIGLHITGNGAAVQVDLINFGRSGLQFRAPEPFPVGTSMAGVFSTERHPIKREVSFVAVVRHCTPDSGKYKVGVQLDGKHDEVSLDFFLNVHDFIAKALEAESE